MENFKLGDKVSKYEEFSEIHSELLFYLEEKVLDNSATYDELITYEDYKLFNKIDLESKICKKLLVEMQEIYMKGYK